MAAPASPLWARLKMHPAWVDGKYAGSVHFSFLVRIEEPGQATRSRHSVTLVCGHAGTRQRDGVPVSTLRSPTTDLARSANAPDTDAALKSGEELVEMTGNTCPGRNAGTFANPRSVG